MSIRQFNASYVATEDRILLRVTLESDEEFRFWLTRAGLKSLFQQVDAWLAPAGALAGDALKAFQREAGAARADFETPLSAGEIFPLGEVPLLVESIRMAASGDDIEIMMQLADHHQANFNITDDVLVGLQHMLRQAAQAADWGIVVPPAAQPLQATGRLH